MTVTAPSGEVHHGLGLASMAVLPGRQRQGVGTALASAALEALRARGHRFCVVLGHEDSDPRLGFQPANRFGLRGPWEVPEGTFMALALAPGGLDGVHGLAQYRTEFDAMEP